MAAIGENGVMSNLVANEVLAIIRKIDMARLAYHAGILVFGILSTLASRVRIVHTRGLVQWKESMFRSWNRVKMRKYTRKSIRYIPRTFPNWTEIAFASAGKAESTSL